MASGDIRPDEALADIERCLRPAPTWCTPSLYSLYDPRSAPPEWVDRLTPAAEEGGATLLVSGVDPGWGNDALRADRRRAVHPHRPSTARRSSTTPPTTSRTRCGARAALAAPMDEVPMMLLPSIPTMVWGGHIRLIGRGLGVDIDEITEEVERLPLEETVDTVMGASRTAPRARSGSR